MDDDTKAPAEQRPVPTSQVEEVFPSPFLPQKSSKRFKTSNVLMWAFGVIAVALIGTGIAAPQVAYSVDAGRYDEIVAEVAALETSAAKTNERAESAEVLLNLQQTEAQELVPRLRSLAKADSTLIPAESGSRLVKAAKAISDELPKAPFEVKGRYLDSVVKSIEEEGATAPITWFTVSPMTAGALAGVEVGDVDIITPEKVVTREVIDETRSRHQEAQEADEAADERLAEREAQVEALGEVVTDALELLSEIGEQAPALAEAVLTEGEPTPEMLESLGTPEPNEANDNFANAAVAVAAAATDSAEFVRLDTAQFVLREELGDDESGTVVTAMAPAERHMLVLSRLELYVGAGTTVLDEQQQRAEEAERLAAEEAARIEAQREAERIAAEEQARREAEQAEQVPPPAPEPVPDPVPDPEPEPDPEPPEVDDPVFPPLYNR